MNIINEALEAAIESNGGILPPPREELGGGNTAGTAQLFFAADFPGFEGHFEGSPVVPGVCLVQVLVNLCRRKTGLDLRIKTLKQVKFFRPVPPETAVDFEFTLTEKNVPECVSPPVLCTFVCRGSASNAEGKIAKIIMELTETTDEHR